MKKDNKFLWIYIAILFSFALILIVFAGLTQNNTKEVEMEAAGLQQNLTAVTEKSQKISDDLKKATEENKTLQTEKLRLSSEKDILVKSIGGDEAVTQTLLDAYVIFAVGDKDAASQKFAGINKTLLNEAQLNIYNTIIGE